MPYEYNCYIIVLLDSHYVSPGVYIDAHLFHRLYPVIPINARVLTEDVVLDSYLIPKGVSVRP